MEQGYFSVCLCRLFIVLILVYFGQSFGQYAIEKDANVQRFEKDTATFLHQCNKSKLEKGDFAEEQKVLKILKNFKSEENFKKFLKELKILEHEDLERLKRLPFDPDAERNGTQLIESRGFLSEEHEVTTVDGFILRLFRVRRHGDGNTTQLPVFLLHGLLSSSDCYINNLRNESLAFILADLGFDVWLGNIRGNRYSTKHQTLQPSDKKFWRWSFDEMGKYDVPVMVDFVLAQTGYKKLNFVGHSEGTTNLITSVIVHGDQMAQKINKFIALAPAVYVGHTKSYMKYLVNSARIVQITWDLLNEGDFFAHDGILGEFGQKYCYYVPRFCWYIVSVLAGPHSPHTNQTRIPVYLSHAPAGTSTQNMVHWAQQIEAGNKFLYYDFGSRWRNYLHYHQDHPPEYDISKFNVPTYALTGSFDWLVVPEDAKYLIQKLPNVKWVKNYKDYSHIDFIWGYDIANTAYKDVVNILLEK